MAGPPAGGGGGVPPGWEQLTSPEGYTYFYNQTTGVRDGVQMALTCFMIAPAFIACACLSTHPTHARARLVSCRRRNGRSPSEAGERRYYTPLAVTGRHSALLRLPLRLAPTTRAAALISKKLLATISASYPAFTYMLTDSYMLSHPLHTSALHCSNAQASPLLQ